METPVETANIDDPASVERIYSRADFERDSRLNAQDKTAIRHGITILSQPDTAGDFSLVRASRHVGEEAESTHSLFLYPELKPSEYGALIQDDTGYGGPVERHDVPEDPADPYRSFVEDVVQAARSAHFPPEAPPELLKGFHGG